VVTLIVGQCSESLCVSLVAPFETLAVSVHTTLCTTFTYLWCACVHVVRKVRVETYLHPDTVAQLENRYKDSVSAVIRDSVSEKLERDKDNE
jgi:hypothetical protein